MQQPANNLQEGKFLLGALVLGCKTRAHVPFFKEENLSSHLDSVFVGKSGVLSSHTTDLYVPSKGQSFRMYSTNRYLEENSNLQIAEVVKSLESSSESHSKLLERWQTASLPDHNLLCLEQLSPIGMNCISSNDSVYLMGVYCRGEIEILYWSNLPDLDDILAKQYHNKYWIYRFKPIENRRFVLFTNRICHRWNRWKNFEPSNRFQALEFSLFSRSDDD